MTRPRRVIDLRADPEADLSPVVTHLRADGVIAYPTETVYGLGGACTPKAIDGVRRVKGRMDDKPLIALVSSATSIDALRWTEGARQLASVFWPGSVTLVLDDPDEVFPPGVRSRAGSVGVRMSPHPLVGRLLEAFGAPLTSTSLNAPGESPVSRGDEAFEVLDRLGAEEVLLLNAGTLPASRPSTVVDCTSSDPVVLREGSVPIGRLRCVLPETHEQRTE